MRIFDYIQQGGPVMYILLVLNIVGFALLIWKVLLILDAKKNVQDKKNQLKEKLSYLSEHSDNSMSITLVKDEIQSSVHELEFGLNTVKIIASIAPLLGLLGTVVGILSAFKVISEVGLSDPSLFAGGISMALLTTVAGLIVSIPHLIGYNYLVSALDDYEMNLEREVIKELFASHK